MGNSEKDSLVNQINYEIVFRREARLEVQEAFRYYQGKSENLGFEFVRALDASLQFIKRNPFAYQVIYKGNPEDSDPQISLRGFLYC